MGKSDRNAGETMGRNWSQTEQSVSKMLVLVFVPTIYMCERGFCEFLVSYTDSNKNNAN